MMKKIIILDGNENTGKSWIALNLIRKLQGEGKRVNPFVIHYPEDSLLKKYFDKIKKGTAKEIADIYFVAELLENIISDFNMFFKEDKYDFFIVDRMVLSTMVYQGSDVCITDMIIHRYGMIFDDWYKKGYETILYPFTEVYPITERDLSCPEKSINDDKIEELKPTIEKMLCLAKSEYTRLLVMNKMEFNNINNVSVEEKQICKLLHILNGVLND